MTLIIPILGRYHWHHTRLTLAKVNDKCIIIYINIRKLIVMISGV